MILVTLGTQDKGFERLLKQVDEEIKKGNIREKVVVQAGYTKYESPNMEIFDLIPADKFDDLVSKARLIITHAGAGSILSAVKKGKVVIAAPRLKKYGEHTNDHQLQIAKEFADAGYILELRDFQKLGKLLEKSKTFKPKKFVSNTSNMVKLVSDYIEEADNISWYNKYSEILWYGFFGVLTTLINIVSFILLDKTGLNVYFSNLLAWFLSVLFAFITNKLFVFDSKDFTFKVFFKELVSFFFFRIVSLGIDMAGMYICLEAIKLNKMISKIIVNVVVIVANYVFSKLFIFKKKVVRFKMKKEKISIIVPCYNEEESLPIFYKEIDRISKDMKEVIFEFLFINDGSRDKTLEILRNMAKKDDRVRYISFSRNFGKEAGMWAGLENATGDYVAIMDADMQDPPSKIKEMYNILVTKKDYDCVGLYTVNHKDYSFFRKLCTNIWYKIIAKVSNNRQVPGVRDFRLMRRPMVNAVLEMKEYNRYTKGIFSFVGFNTFWIEFETGDRVAGTSKYSFWKLFKYAMEGIVSFSTTPLVLSALIGLLFCLVAFILLIVIIVKTLVWGDAVSGWPSLACIVVFFSGIQLFFLGVIGMYLSKTYLEVKKRPIYIVKETEKDLQ